MLPNLKRRVLGNHTIPRKTQGILNPNNHLAASPCSGFVTSDHAISDLAVNIWSTRLQDVPQETLAVTRAHVRSQISRLSAGCTSNAPTVARGVTGEAALVRHPQKTHPSSANQYPSQYVSPSVRLTEPPTPYGAAHSPSTSQTTRRRGTWCRSVARSTCSPHRSSAK